MNQWGGGSDQLMGVAYHASTALPKVAHVSAIWALPGTGRGTDCTSAQKPVIQFGRAYPRSDRK